MIETHAGKTYLVTGGAGFIGSHTVRALLDRGASVIVVDEFNDFYDPAIKEANIAAFEHNPRFHLYRQDIREFIGLRDIFERHGGALCHGGIIHLAARAGVRPSLKEPRLYLETNVTGTLNLAELAREFGIRKFVFASSSSVYGDSPERVPFREDQDISKPISPYASTKAMGESLLHTYSHLYDLQVVALRFFTVYGAGQRPDLAIHKFTRLIDEGKPIPVFGDGSTRRDYTYIDDIIQGVMAAVAYEATPYEIFNLGESQTTELSALIALIEESLGKKAIIDRQPMQPGDVSVTYADISKARQLLGYNPTIQIPEGIPRFVEWYRTWQSGVNSCLLV
ncbi:MAG TPA: GDP-mannose 4,6-dehydratase [Coleofasciculaceae cyanobacterium]|jgi:UDP-glucuronate 4-epimerase